MQWERVWTVSKMENGFFGGRSVMQASLGDLTLPYRDS